MATRLCYLQQELCDVFPEYPQCLCQRYPSIWDHRTFIFVAAMGVEPIIFQYDTRRGHFLNK